MDKCSLCDCELPDDGPTLVFPQTRMAVTDADCIAQTISTIKAMLAVSTHLQPAAIPYVAIVKDYSASWSLYKLICLSCTNAWIAQLEEILRDHRTESR